MAKIKYGTTLWGSEFLKAIERETDLGRLGRGKTYANTGKVYDVSLQSKTISAKVKGNYSPFYSTNLIFKQFATGDKKFIISHIDNNPLLLADIMNSKLSVELLSFLKENEIDLFSGFDMSCNCYDFYGDYACKHIAGLYFMLVSEIDKNPFILFSLRGLNLIEHYNIKKDLEIPYPIEIEYKERTTQETQAEYQFEMLQFNSQKEFILSMLESDPPFAPVDYKKVIEEFYKKTTKELPLIVSLNQTNNRDRLQRVLQEVNIHLESDSDISDCKFILSSSLFSNTEVQELFAEYDCEFYANELIIRPTQLFNLFISCEDDKGSREYQYLFYLFRVAYILLSNSCFIPAVYESKKSLKIFYKPLFSLEIVNKQIEKLANLSADIALFKNRYLSEKSQTELLLSIVFNDFVPHLNFMHKAQKNNPPTISYAFFKAVPFKTDQFKDANVALGIKNYFAIFDILKSDFRYRLFIDKKISNYELVFKVQEKHSEREFTLKESLELSQKMQIAKFISFLKPYLPEIVQLLENNSITLKRENLEEFLLKTANIISNLGVSIILPKELKNLLKPKLSLHVSSKSKSHKSFFTLDGMLDYSWQLAIGDEIITIEEFEKLLSSGKELIEFRDKFLVISPEEAKAIFAQINKKSKLNTFDILHAKLSNEAVFDIDLEHFFEDILTPRSITVPPSLQATLREYQLRGFEWNIHNLLNGFGTILADDMGLGKTVQAITTLLYLIENKYLNFRT